ncbi:MAG: hypothetical protein ACKVJK_09535 [Methylophagaceae bacterium]|jgi:hypothetical protein|tara:strand:- start:3752 stop:4003 length:252 start_codon:yes stop_codon:yes gene_type:complete
MDKKVLSKEELQKLKDFQTKEDSLVILFGQIAYQQHSLEEEQDRAIEEKEKFNKERLEFASNLTSKYGNGTINIDTGEITPVD